MTERLPCPIAPGPLEAYAERFDDRLGTLAQRPGFREYLQGLLLPRDRHKTLTGLVGTEPVVGAQAPSVQRLQFFLSESPWDAEAINRRRLELVVAEKEEKPAPRRGWVRFDAAVRNQRDEVVIEGEWLTLIQRRRAERRGADGEGDGNEGG